MAIDLDQQLEQAWYNFHNGKDISAAVLRKEIMASWIRCRDWGVDPYLPKVPVVMNDSDLRQEMEHTKGFLEVAIPVMENLYSVVKGSGFGVWVANENGIILHGMADPDVIRECERGGMTNGADFTEQAFGTNAIGTALYLKDRLQVRWAEHYCKVCHEAACSAVPIQCNGEIIGVLSMIGYQQRVHPHTMGMVVAGAHAIQRELFLHTMHQKIRLSHQYVLEMMEALPSGVIVVNSQGNIKNINRKACEMLKVPAEELADENIFVKFGPMECIERALKFGKAQEDAEQYLNYGKQKLHFVMSCRPIMNSQGLLDGAVIILREIEAVIRMTSKMAGYQAKITFANIIGQTPQFTNVIKQAQSAAATASNILILGESGTGKEMVAQAIHNASPRRYGPFVAINCGALPRELIGSELFGYDEGAFTGAKRGGSPGKFELANNGTIFLDEIGDMPLDLQLVLLRVLQDKMVVRLGGQQPIQVNVRLIAATNKDIQRMVNEGLFRKDLFYRINVVTLQLPPLRERVMDIILLAQHFLKIQAEKNGREVVKLSPRAQAVLETYQWPGNIRELENLLERALVFSDDEVLQEDALHVPGEDSALAGENTFEQAGQIVSLRSGERSLILNTLNRYQWNISQAARNLGITRATLYRKMRFYNLY